MALPDFQRHLLASAAMFNSGAAFVLRTLAKVGSCRLNNVIDVYLLEPTRHNQLVRSDNCQGTWCSCNTIEPPCHFRVSTRLTRFVPLAPFTHTKSGALVLFCKIVSKSARVGEFECSTGTIVPSGSVTVAGQLVLAGEEAGAEDGVVGVGAGVAVMTPAVAL